VDGGESNKTGQVGENKQTTNVRMMLSESWPSGQAGFLIYSIQPSQTS
jgi:hypothetical protein